MSASSNASRITKPIADGCSEVPHCVFSAVDYVKFHRGPFEHPSASPITIRIALELVSKPYDLLSSSNANRLTIRLTDVCSKGPRCVFSALDYVKLQRIPSEHPLVSRITKLLALELAGKPYDLPTRSNANRLTIRLVDGCSEVPHCVFSALNYVKLQHGPFKHSSANRMHPSANRMVMRFTIELADKPYDLSANSNVKRITKRLADGCSKDPRCILSALDALDCVKLQRGPFEHPSTNRITIRFALELVDKSYYLLASSNASYLTIRLADGCSEGPRCIFSALECVKLQRGPFEHPSANRITIPLALELAGNPYDLPASSNASRLTMRLVDGFSEEHPSANCMVMRLAIELAGKPYDLSASSNASRKTERLTDGCSKGPRCILSALDSNANRITKRLADVCSEGPRCVFSALNYVKSQRGTSKQSSTNRIVLLLPLKLAGKSYDLSASSNASRITKRLADGCSEDLRCVFSALNYVKLQRGSFKHRSVNRITIRLALELASKPYDLPTSSNASRLTIRIAMAARKIHIAFSVL
ncbi:hypothetical protein L7F22_039618 [Adiantum nelumboides]|nr:hypothetical protein [Adiantum nelumboides]